MEQRRTPHVGTPPQSDDEILPILTALQRMDPDLDLRWNAEAYVEKYGQYDEMGRPSRPVYAARWQVIRYNTDSLHPDRGFAVIISAVTPVDWSNKKVPVMTDKGPYSPINWSLVDYLQLWDRAQGAHAAYMAKRLWAEHDTAHASSDMRAANQEALEKVYRTHGSEYWTGGAQGKAHPDTVRGLWGKVKDTVAAIAGRTPSPSPSPHTDN